MDRNARKRDRHPNGVLGSIAGKISSTSHLVRDKTEKINTRVHGHWCKSTNTPTKTVDEEFEELVQELDAITEACQEIISLHKHYISISIELVQSSQRVANAIQVLSRPSANESGETPTASGNLCERTKSYAATMAEIGLCLKESLRTIPVNLDERIKRLLSFLEKIHERVAIRDKALMSYDKVYEKFDGMTILSTTNEFTSKQMLEYHSLEKKLVELRKSYDDHNWLLKKELPSFFLLVRTFIEPVMQFLFFVQLTAAYQVQSNLVSICQLLHQQKPTPTSTLPIFQSSTTKNPLKEQNDDLTFVLQENVMNVTFEQSGKRKNPPLLETHQYSKRPSTARDKGDYMEQDSPVSYCRALFNYCSVVNTDLEFKKGDVILIFSSEGDWWSGLLGGSEGVFPSLYVEKM